MQRHAGVPLKQHSIDLLEKSFELTEYARQLLKDGLRHRHPGLSERQLHQLFLERVRRCHNENY